MEYQEFIDQLVNNFPEIKGQVLDEDDVGLITLQMGTFKRFTQKAINENNIQTVKKCFDFISLHNSMVNSRIQNSIGITYLAKLTIRKNSKIEKLLPPELKNIRDSLHRHYNSVSENKGFNNFINELEQLEKKKKS
ncbi:DUF7674 family protein [Mucilaginibacter ginsenosidivorans]|uniref:DUF7674 domain-containing protein n=1 Tax=Mucilaginibacter ginsenosidivorans TaxID=398053 RepID=A0A5B8V0P8_9SPHI|nr:hypothetical protein [Mucilaginibacter ginsenosidivorans]QEC64778.1 hypothetical protein FRZ54_20150 [Mucilaginibacter ginsenosidivorans]